MYIQKKEEIKNPILTLGYNDFLSDTVRYNGYLVLQLELKSGKKIITNIKTKEQYLVDRIMCQFGFVIAISIADNHTRLFNEDGELISEGYNIEYHTLSDNYFIKQDKSTNINKIFDKKGNFISSFVMEFEHAKELAKDTKSFILFQPNKGMGIVNLEGKIISPIGENHIQKMNNGLYLLLDNKRKRIKIIDSNGEVHHDIKKSSLKSLDIFPTLFAKNIITVKFSKTNTIYTIHFPNNRKKEYLSLHILSSDHAIGKRKDTWYLIYPDGREKKLPCESIDFSKDYICFTTKDEYEYYDSSLKKIYSESLTSKGKIQKGNNELIVSYPDKLLKIIPFANPKDKKFYYDVDNYSVLKHQNISIKKQDKEFFLDSEYKPQYIFNYQEHPEVYIYQNIDDGLLIVRASSSSIEKLQDPKYKKDAGLFDMKTNSYLINPIYNRIGLINTSDKLLIYSNGYVGLADRDGNILIKPTYIRIVHIKDDYFSLDGKIVDINNISYDYCLELYGDNNELLAKRKMSSEEKLDTMYDYFNEKLSQRHNRISKYLKKQTKEYQTQFENLSISDINSINKANEEVKKLEYKPQNNSDDISE